MVGVTRCGYCKGTLEPQEKHERGCPLDEVEELKNLLRFSTAFRFGEYIARRRNGVDDASRDGTDGWCVEWVHDPMRERMDGLTRMGAINEACRMAGVTWRRGDH